MRVRYGLGADPKDPHDNITAGTAYLHDMYERFGSGGFIAAYNAGPQRYEDHLATGRSLPDETLAYVAQLAPLLGGTLPGSTAVVAKERTPWRQAPLFLAQASGRSADKPSPFAPRAVFIRVDRVIADLSALVPLSGGLFISNRKAGARP